MATLHQEMVVNICLNGGHPQFYDLAISFNKVWDLWQATCLNFTWEGLSCTLIFHDFPCIGRLESPSIPAIWHSHGGPCVDDLPIQKNGRRFPLQFAMSNWFKLPGDIPVLGRRMVGCFRADVFFHCSWNDHGYSTVMIVIIHSQLCQSPFME